MWEIFLKHFNLNQVLKKQKKAANTSDKFFFCHITEDQLRQFIMNLDSSKPPL